MEIKEETVFKFKVVVNSREYNFNISAPSEVLATGVLKSDLQEIINRLP